MKQIALLALALAVLWMLLSGHFDVLLLSFGVASVAFVSWIAQRMRVIDGESYPFGLVPRLLGYWFWLLIEIVKSNVDTVRRVFGPKSAVQPVIFDAPAKQANDLALVIHANSITLTPGTVSLELEDDKIVVHALHPDVARAAVENGMNERVPN
ncbi:MAG: Na+/H+ antiporter subunit E [Gammaproteobacteria bacterium]|nr:Na+/H+ antiporter subunit E [Gammaproteobacteria bacterium]